ncbi:Uma2 family endonuclease [Paracraurococcus lichenis]|uniref:Uma2 family endonuclease n=1 Tax=Paracraurococcus lichenis TaxID=3064888 RepID=A0ABT9E2Y3_9PROT|nr:Uma2 family endonuclease [Paracraurococcus sp. LOR1-02]MDO9710457.1 Uma2 family endonuclease [Paracraurococcus sp. LOR1-02]
MNAAPQRRMTADEFIDWADRTDFRGELVAGEPVAMSPERIEHGEVKGTAYAALRDAIRRARLPCQAIVDSVAVRVDDGTVYMPDVLVRCGSRLPRGTIIVPDPLIVVEVLSPSTAATDAGAKLEDYFRIPSVMHYLMLRTDRRTIIHHARDEAGGITTRILRSGALVLDPPGLTLDLAALFEDDLPPA